MTECKVKMLSIYSLVKQRLVMPINCLRRSVWAMTQCPGLRLQIVLPDSASAIEREPEIVQINHLDGSTDRAALWKCLQAGLGDYHLAPYR